MEIIARKFAAAANLPTYYTGKLCKNGHLAYRYTKSGACSVCVNGERTVDLRRAEITENELSARDVAKRAQVEAAQAMAREDAQRRQQAQDAAAKFAEQDAVRKRQRQELTEQLFTVFDAVWPEFRQSLIALTQVYLPHVTDDDISPQNNRVGNVASGVGQYRVFIRSEDFRVLLQIIDTLSADINGLIVAAISRRRIEKGWDK